MTLREKAEAYARGEWRPETLDRIGGAVVSADEAGYRAALEDFAAKVLEKCRGAVYETETFTCPPSLVIDLETVETAIEQAKREVGE